MPGYRPPIAEAQAQMTVVWELMLPWRCILLPFNPSARRRRVAELQVLIMCRNNEQPPAPKKVPKQDEVILSASVRQMGCVPFWLIKTTDIGARGGLVVGDIETGWGWSKDRALASTRCQMHGCCRGGGVGGGGDERGKKKKKKKNALLSIFFEIHPGPDASPLPAKRVWILESPGCSSCCRCIRGPVAQWKENKTEFSLQPACPLCDPLPLRAGAGGCVWKGVVVWEEGDGCRRIAVFHVLSAPLARSSRGDGDNLRTGCLHQKKINQSAAIK